MIPVRSRLTEIDKPYVIPRRKPQILAWHHGTQICGSINKKNGNGHDFARLTPTSNGNYILAMGHIRGQFPKISSHAVLLDSMCEMVFRELYSLEAMFQTANELIRGLEDLPMIQLMAVLICPENRTVHYIRAGYEAPVIIGGAEGVDFLSDGNGPPLGFVTPYVYVRARREIAPGSVIVLASSDLVAGENRKQERFGLERLYKASSESSARQATHIHHNICESFNEFRNPIEPLTDPTLVVVKM